MTHEEVAERVKQLVAAYAEYHIAQESIDELHSQQRVYLDAMRRLLSSLGYRLSQDAEFVDILAVTERTIARWEAKLWALEDDDPV